MSRGTVIRKLLVDLPSGDTEEVLIDPDVPFSIGSSDNNTVVIRRPGVADRHCNVVVLQDRAVLVNVSPTTQTLLNGAAITREQLKDGDRISVGPIDLNYREIVLSAAERPCSVSTAVGTRDRSQTKPSTEAGSPISARAQTPRPHTRRLPIILAVAGVVAAGAVATYVLRTTGESRMRRERERIAVALDERRFKLVVSLCTEYLESYPDAPDRLFCEEVSSYAALMNQLRSFQQGDLERIIDGLREYLDAFADGQHRDKLLSEASGLCSREAQKTVERADLTPANLARAENLLGLARNWAQKAPASPLIPDLATVQGSIRAAREEIMFRGELETLQEVCRSALTEDRFNACFGQLKRIRGLYPTKELPSETREYMRRIREAERKAASLGEVALPTQRTQLDAPTQFAQQSVRIQYRVRGNANRTSRRICVVHGATCYVLDAATGELVWSKAVGHRAFWAPVVLDNKGLVITGSGDTGLTAWNLADGTRAWDLELGARILGPPERLGDRLYVLTSSGDLVAFSSQGKVAGAFRLHSQFDTAGGLDSWNGRWAGSSANGTLFILNLKRGECERIEHDICHSGLLSLPPILVGPFVMWVEGMASHRSRLHVLELSNDEQLVRTFELEGWTYQPPVVSAGVMAMPTDAGKVYVFGLNATNADEGFFAIGDFDWAPAESEARVARLDVAYRTIRFLLLTDHVKVVTVDLMTGRGEGEPLHIDRPPQGIGGRCVGTISYGSDLFILSRPPHGESLVVTRTRLQSPDQVEWQTVLGERLYSLQALGGEQAVFVSGRNALTRGLPRGVVAVDETRATNAQWTPEDMFSWDDAEGVAFVWNQTAGTRDGTIGAYDMTGKPQELWLEPVPDALAARPLLMGRFVFVLARSGKAAVYDRADGRLASRWIEVLPAIPEQALVAGPASLSGERISVAARGTLSVITIATDTLVTRLVPMTYPLTLEGEAYDLAANPDYLFLVDTTGQIHVRDANTLEPVGSMLAERGTRFMSLPGKEAILTFSPAGVVSLLAGPEAKWFWVPPDDSGIVGQPVATAGTIVITLRDGFVFILDASSGALVESHSAPVEWSAPVRITPTLLYGLTQHGELWTCERTLPTRTVDMPVEPAAEVESTDDP